MSSADEQARWVSAAQATAIVVLFWWLATGLLLGLPASAAGRQVAAVVASLVGGSGLALAIVVRDDRSPRAAWFGFLAGATLWGWVQAAFYGGWLVGPGLTQASTLLPDSRIDAALEALRETAWSEAAAVGVLGLTAVLAFRARNRVAFWTVALLWAAHQMARVNVLLGVANADPELLPPHLAFLKRFFGPAVNTPLLPLSIVVWSTIAVLLLRRAWQARDLFQRRTGLMLGVLAALAALEHAVLGVPVTVPLWQFFLRSRAG